MKKSKENMDNNNLRTYQFSKQLDQTSSLLQASSNLILSAYQESDMKIFES